MNLTTKDLKNIFLKDISSKQTVSELVCPPVDEIMKALRFPSKKTKKIMNHILDCHKCLPLFIFLKEIAKAEEDLINSINEIKIDQKISMAKAKAAPPLRFLNLIPYATVAISLILIFFSIFKYISLSENRTIRSPRSEAYLLLVEGVMSKEPCTLYLKWTKIPQAKSYSVYIFDPSLICLWSNVMSENMCLLPAEICEKIRSGLRLSVYFEAKEEEGKIIYSWLGELSSIQVISGQK